MSLESYLKEIADDKKDLVISRLTDLSALSPSNLELFRKSWAQTPVERRREIISNFIHWRRGTRSWIIMIFSC